MFERNGDYYENDKEKRRKGSKKKALLEAQRNLQDAYTGLANVKDPDLIDCYIYEVNAANLRYQVILRDYKQLESQKKKTDAISQSRNCQTASAPLFPHA